MPLGRGIQLGREAGGDFFTSLLDYLALARERQREQEEGLEEGQAGIRETAREAYLKGEIEPGTREEAVLTTREAEEPSGFLEQMGLAAPRQRKRYWRRTPVTAPEVRPGEKATRRYGPRGKLTGTTVSPISAREPTYSEIYRKAVQQSVDRILGGEDYNAVVGDLQMEHPTEYDFDTERNLKAMRKQATQLRKQAIRAIKQHGLEPTEANIKAGMQYLRQRR